MAARRKRREETDLGRTDFTCPHCGHEFRVDLSTVLDLQEMTSGFVGLDTSQVPIICPECGEDVNEEPRKQPPAQAQRPEKLPREIRADQERAFLHAYYRYVCKAGNVVLDFDLNDSHAFVVMALSPDRAWLADFSTYYEFPLEMKPATVRRRMLERAEDAQRNGTSFGRLWNDDFTKKMEVSYEVWCFMPPSSRLLETLAAARAEGAQVVLVSPDQLTERIRATVNAVPEQVGEEHAFVKAAVMIRKALGR